MANYRFDGEWSRDGMILESLVTNEIIHRLKVFEMKTGDYLIATYPKTGTTWIQELIWLICNNADINAARSVPVYTRIPYMEIKPVGSIAGLDKVLMQQSPRFMKTHLRSEIFCQQIKAGKVKIIIGIRNPKDTLVSLYHFYRMNRTLGNFNGSWDDFFELYKAKHLLYGDYFQWYSSWLQYKDKPNVKLIKYEDMHRRMPDVIHDILQFVDKSLPKVIIDNIIKHLDFGSMSQNKAVNYKGLEVFNMEISPFMRKGIIGDWKNYFSDEQSALVDKSYREIIESFGVNLSFE